MNEKQMTLGRDYEGQTVAGWFVTEKLDGCRAYWDGSQLWTRGGNVIAAPEWFTAGLPKGEHLDGEVWAGRGKLNEARVAVQHGKFTEACRFAVFDCPGVEGDYPARLSAARERTRGCPHAFTVEISTVKTRRGLARRLTRIFEMGGEGVMLRNPKTKTYEVGRTKNLLKLKSVFLL